MIQLSQVYHLTGLKTIKVLKKFQKDGSDSQVNKTSPFITLKGEVGDEQNSAGIFASKI
jgi:hypothetical protein